MKKKKDKTSEIVPTKQKSAQQEEKTVMRPEKKRIFEERLKR